MSLRLDWIDYKSAKYAVERWHYSANLPRFKLVKIGVWEDSKFIGVVIYSGGACNNLVKPYGLTQFEGAELTRIALKGHKSSVSKIISISVNMVKKLCPKLRLLVSFADTRQNHVGIIYQAANWIYNGTGEGKPQYFVNGRWYHQRAIGMTFGSLDKVKGCSMRGGSTKHRYLMPLDKQMRKQIEPLRKPYPKRMSVESYRLPVGKGGAIPTHTLQGALNEV